MTRTYDFTAFKALSDSEFDEVNKLPKEKDLSGLGFRVFIDKFGDESPLVIEAIKSVVFKSKHIKKPDMDGQEPSPTKFIYLPELITSGGTIWQKYDPRLMEKISYWKKPATILPMLPPGERLRLPKKGQSTSPRFFSKKNAATKDTLHHPREIIKLKDYSLDGERVRIAIIDYDFELGSFKLQQVDLSGAISPNYKREFHGTKVLSVVSKTEFAISPASELFIVKLTPGQVSLGSVVLGLILAANWCADFINVSVELGQQYGKIPDFLSRAIKYCTDRNCLIVAGVTNDSFGQCSTLALSPNTLSVAATSSSGSLLFGSSDSPYKIDCVSQGFNVMSRPNLAYANDSDFGGSSVATAMVTGALALLKQMTSEKNNFELKKIFLSEHCIRDSEDPFWGKGMVSLSI